ncbi:signal recognition particle-docking protein FtsY [Luteimonas kalidii]|uniref:Signal recognition particle receptor FtsY n=1 Tax=Luteimonas kalidii TaxID=3042025 RepID=A0ABT6JY53_9GAMM|nr:signal recognition particle-docking protein FtsY [Luteimonas kalidii]MDH5835616.1 signal recognition particle-docking protein FtsY [Luteimonas kalidii]
MIRLFGRKKPGSDATGEREDGRAAERRGGFSIEELAAAFPDAAPTEPTPSADVDADMPASSPAGQPSGAKPDVPATPEATPSASQTHVRASVVDAPVAPAPASAPTAATPAPSVSVSVPVPAPTPAAPEQRAAPVQAQPTSAPVVPPSPAPASTPAVPPVAPAPVPVANPPSIPAVDEVDGSGAQAPPAAEGKRGWRDRLRGSAFARGVGGLFSRNPKLDDDLLDEIETALLTADVGVAATTQLVEDLRRRMKAREFADANALLAALREDLIAMLRPIARPLQVDTGAKPFVILTVGVNGVGKTTTIGKLARRFKDEGHALMLAAGDTFRAAAVAQLQAWGERNGVAVIAQGQDADPASVAFDALQAAKSRGTGVLIADTAGRLHTQQGLMAELGKIRRVLGKLDPSAPHEVLMVIDGTTGQNALSQLRQFHAAVNVTGLVVTKLDGTAKGGVVFALAREFGIPIRFAGIGERPEDLRVFDAEAFVDALLPERLGG